MALNRASRCICSASTWQIRVCLTVHRIYLMRSAMAEVGSLSRGYLVPYRVYPWKVNRAGAWAILCTLGSSHKLHMPLDCNYMLEQTAFLDRSIL